jgi:thiamine pyrophosphokinase
MGTNVKNLMRIVESVEIVALLGGGTSKKTELMRVLSLAPRLFCADGGGNRALDWGVAPEKVIGDLDSVDIGKMEAAGIETVFIADQNSTDFEKCLGVISAPLILGVGFLGGRLDHQLAVLNALARNSTQPVVLLGQGELCFLCPPVFVLELPENTRFSLFPLAPSRCESTGLVWPLDGLTLSPTGKIATSNAAIGGVLRIKVLSGAVMCILPDTYLDAVVSFFID